MMNETLARVPIEVRRKDSWPDIPGHVPLELVRELDYLDPNTRVDPFSVTENIYEDLPPVVFSPFNRLGIYKGIWVVTRYEDIREVYQNDVLYSTEGAAGFQTMVGETFRMIPLAVDPPEHAKYRLLLNPWFSPKAINVLDPKILSNITGLIDEFAGLGGCDAVYDFGRIYPVRVFLDFMGLPRDRVEDFLAWEHAILHHGGDAEKMKWGVRSAIEYLRSFVEDVRAHPTDLISSAIVHGEVEGRPITDDEVIGTMFFLWVGGLDTVAATTALIVRRLALEPQLQDRLRADPDLIPDAIEEFLRMQPLVNSTRLVKQDHEIHGVKIKQGDHIMAYNSAGNFDPNEFECPRQVRLERSPNRHFTFGGGPHRCLGSHLARRELKVALTEFLRRIPRFRLSPEADLSVYPSLGAVSRLPIVWDV